VTRFDELNNFSILKHELIIQYYFRLTFMNQFISIISSFKHQFFIAIKGNINNKEEMSKFSEVLKFITNVSNLV
jgi:hypothetical protein